jgi:hypothetical protein
MATLKGRTKTMKTLLAFILTASISAQAADFWGQFTLAPVIALKAPNIDGDGILGAGAALSFRVNDFVSLQVHNLAYESNNWRDSTIDETSFLVKADITKFKWNSFVPYFIGGGQRDWTREDWGFSAGVGAQYNFSKKISLGADYSLRAWFNNDKDSLARGFLSISF